jgi:hypothetical protein
MKRKFLLALIAICAAKFSLAQTKIPVPEILNEINYYNKTGKSLQGLEKARAELKSKAKALGYGGIKQNFELDGDKSIVRLAAQDSISFIVTLNDGEPSAWFNLYKAEVKKKKRIANWSDQKMFGKSGPDDDVISFSVRKIGDIAFEIIPVGKLKPGEYLFINKASLGNYAGRGANAFAFGID